MTGLLHVSLECGYAGGPPAGVLTHVVGNIFASDPANPSQRAVAFPMGSTPAPAPFELAAGRYVVEAGLPSGLFLTEDVEVVDGQTTTVQFDLTTSAPFTSHTLQYVLGNIESSAVFHNEDAYPVPNSQGSRAVGGRDAAQLRPLVPPQAEVAVLSRAEDEPLGIEDLNQLRQRSPTAATLLLDELLAAPEPPVPLSPRYTDEQAPIFRLDDETPVPLPASRYQYLRVTAPGEAYLVTAPWSWMDGFGRKMPVEVLLNLRQSPTGSAVSVAVLDPGLGGGLGYLAAGSLDKAAVLFGDVESMVHGKVQNPLAAAAGGYVLVGTETTGEIRKWDAWLGNLRAWFPEISDGAILWGARRLRTSRTEAGLAEARTALLEGYHRGLPVYTLGLAWLMDGLSVFSEDPECAAALQEVRQLCWQADMVEPFVVLRLGGDR
jgi:hypothetical protein